MNMTDEEILSAAEACGMMLSLGLDEEKVDFSILTFAKFIGKIERFKERAACANKVQDWNTALTDQIAAEIRARGEA